MTYKKQGFADGQTLYAANLIKMEEAIIEAQVMASSSGGGGGSSSVVTSEVDYASYNTWYIDGSSYIMQYVSGNTMNTLLVFPIEAGASYVITPNVSTKWRVAFGDVGSAINGTAVYDYTIMDNTASYEFEATGDYGYCYVHIGNTSDISGTTVMETKTVTDSETSTMEVDYATHNTWYVDGTSHAMESGSSFTTDNLLVFAIQGGLKYTIRPSLSTKWRVSFGDVGSVVGGYVVSDYTILDNAPSYEFEATGDYGFCYVHIANTSDVSGTTVIAEGEMSDLVSSVTIQYVASEYGVKTDATDNTSAMQGLIDMVSEKGGTIWVPNGTYCFAGTIYAKSNVSIVGENMEMTILKKTTVGAWPLFSYMGDRDAPITGCTYSNFTVDEYDTGNTNDVAGKSFYYQYVRNCVWRDIILKGSIATALGVDYLDNVLIENVCCIDCGRTFTGAELGTSGIGIGTGGWENENFQVSNCVCVGCGQFGIFIENQLQLFGNGYEEYSKGCVISNCVVRNGLNHGIGVRGGQNVTVIGCESYENAKSGYSIESLCENVKIANCSAAYNATSGIRLAQDTTSDHVALIGNTCTNNTGSGISVETATRGLCVIGNYTDGNSRGLTISSATFTDAAVKNNCTIDGVTSSATFSGVTTYVDVS